MDMDKGMDMDTDMDRHVGMDGYTGMDADTYADLGAGRQAPVHLKAAARIPEGVNRAAALSIGKASMDPIGPLNS